MMMHDFHYRKGTLHCEGVSVLKIAEQVGTPFYLYSHKTLTEHYLKLEQAFQSARPLICFSVKANSSLAVLRALVKKGSGLDVVSGGELYRAKKAGCPASRIVYAGVGKTDSEITEAIQFGILLFNVESIPELERINTIAQRLSKRTRVSIRINPGVDPHTHDHIATGKAESKFGIDLQTARRIFRNAAHYSSVSLCGIHVHIGSQIVQGEPFVQAFEKVLLFVDHLEAEGVKIQFLNLGGGLGIIYSDERPQTASEFASKILPLFRSRSFRLIFEPGRFIAGNSGIFVTKVLFVKETPAKNFAIVDGGMNDLIRPALYGSFHDLWPVMKKNQSQKFSYDVVGPICESGDFLAKNRKISKLKTDDLLALASAGAYGFTMSSNYNARPRVPEVLVRGRKFSVIREREKRTDLIRGEHVPSWV